jgi:hypothetical protein
VTVASVRTHTDAVVVALEAAGLSVGDGSGDGLSVPYCVVYNISGGRMSGNLDDPFEDADLVYQVTCVGQTREQAEWVADKATVTLVNGLSVTGRSIVLVTPEGGPGTRPDRDVTPPVYFTTPRFTIKSTPA